MPLPFVSKKSFLNFNTVLFLLSGVCLFALFLWMWQVKPYFGKLPADFSYQARVNSTDNFYDSNAKHYTGEIKSQSEFSYRVVERKENALVLENSFDVRKYSGEPIFSVNRHYAIDPHTMQHVPGLGDHDRSGYLFAPKNLKKQDFTYWHVNYDAPALMKFQRQDSLYGLPVYVYTASFSADQTSSLTNLPEVGKTRGIIVDTELTIWVEPTTGWLVSYQDESVAWYYNLDTKQKIEPWNTFSNTFTEESIKSQVVRARELIYQNFLYERLLPYVLVGSGVFLLVTFMIGKLLGDRAVESVPLAILILGLVFTYAIHVLTEQNSQQLVASRFDIDAKALQNLLTKRLEIYSSALESTVAFMNSSDFVSREEWRLYVDKLDLQQEYPGIQGIGFAEVIQPDQLSTFEQAIRKEGFPTFKVTPEGKRDVYTSIKYLEPFDARNKRAFGFDMFQEPTRHDAMLKTALINEPVISKKVKLLQETETDVQAGFLMYIPVYSQSDDASESGKLQGYVYAAFRMNDFMKGALENQNFEMNIDIFDGSPNGEARLDKEALMFSSHSADQLKDQDTSSLQRKTQAIQLYESQWTLVFSGDQWYGLDFVQKYLHRIVVFFGVLITVLATLATYGLTATRGKALSLAKQITRELSNKSQELEKTNQQLSAEVAERKRNQEVLIEKTSELERMNKLMVGRELEMKSLKEKLQGKTPQ